MSASSRGNRSENSRGAVLVEAAMVLPLVIIILIGTFEFGLAMSDLISVRQGTRDATRSAVVANYGSDTCVHTRHDTHER